ncbi:hypothetical protein AJ88_18095 [Mesorhizobium amorphae CCBAU 01583]|nr:hypothetical protein AJ88_18095 [Mesorhizobium amorphae CCBAU 01583]
MSTTRGEIRAKKVALAVAGSTGRVMQLAGIDKMPIESHVLQAFVTESLKPIIDTILTFGMGHFYISQSDKGGLVYGGDLDGYNSYAQRGSLPIVDEVMSEMLALFPGLARVRMLRSWGGVCDMTMDGSPIITTGPLPACISTAAGATAASRQRRPPAGALPGPSPRTSRTTSTRPSRSTASIVALSSTTKAKAPHLGCIRVQLRC